VSRHRAIPLIYLSDPFDLLNSDFVRRDSVFFVADWRKLERDIPPTGSFVIDYPFEKPCTRLGEGLHSESAENSESPAVSDAQTALEVEVRKAIDAAVRSIVALAVKAGCCEHDVTFLITELLKNATQYGNIGDQVGRAGLLKLDWSIAEDPNDPSIGITVSNPTSKLFDPSRYCRMSQEEYLLAFLEACESEGPLNAHGGAMALAGLSKPGTPLTYLWNLEDGGYIMLTISRKQAVAQETIDGSDSGSSDFTVEAKRFDPDKQQVSGYNLESFDDDVKIGIAVRSVTVACVLGKARIS